MSRRPRLPGTFGLDIDTNKRVTEVLRGEGNYKADRHAIYRGVVEYNRDPQHRGRVMVRTLEHGPEMQISNEELPRVATFDLGWCEPLFGLGAGMGYGAFSVPPVGSRVFVMYLRSNPETPVYFGGWYANTVRQRRYGDTKTTITPPKDPITGEDKYPSKPSPSWGFWDEEQGPEIPLENFETDDDRPDIHWVFKTLKGASLMIKERDYNEELVITDRQGAELRFESATDDLYRRPRASSNIHKLIGRDNLVHNHQVLLTDAIRQGLAVENHSEGESLVIRSNSLPNNSKTPDLYDDALSVELDKDQGRLRIRYLEDGVEIGAIELDAFARRFNIRGIDNIDIDSDHSIRLKAPSVVIEGDLVVKGEVLQEGENKHIYLDNDTEPYGAPTRNFRLHNNKKSPFTGPKKDEFDYKTHSIWVGEG